MSDTPGPWTVSGDPGGWYVDGPARAPYADSYLNEADARLMAAAPDLLAALERIDTHVRRWPTGHLDSGCVGVARTAIAKAKETA